MRPYCLAGVEVARSAPRVHRTRIYASTSLVNRFKSRYRFALVTRYRSVTSRLLFGWHYRREPTARASLYDIRLIEPDGDDSCERLTFYGSATYF